MDWYNSLIKSSLTPPSWVFSIVWPILYVMMAIAVFIIWQNTGVSLPVLIFFIQLGFNFAWSPIFFRQQKIGLALLIILTTLGLTLYTMYLFYPINKTATWLLVPYAIWLTFATYLNWYIYHYN